MSKPRLLLVGGFLGAGKTTLLAEAATRLMRQGKRVGLIANDQAADLVDTQILKDAGAGVEEVAGGCFCCRFPDMVAAIKRLVHQAEVDMLLGEPVGSCTDLSATVMQPLKQLYAEAFDTGPFSVLVDARQVGVLARLQAAGENTEPVAFPDSVLYIYRKQLEEADVIVLNKADLLAPSALADLRTALAEKFPQTPILAMSALTGDGVGGWLEFVAHSQSAGQKLAEVDYDTYAAGEAALGWLNASAKLEARQAIDWQAFAVQLLEAIRQSLRAQGAQIAHLKLYLAAGGTSTAGNITGNDSPVSVRGEVSAAERGVSLTLNARVHATPDLLRNVVQQSLASTAGEQMAVKITNMRSFFPERPQPTYRFDRVV